MRLLDALSYLLALLLLSTVAVRASGVQRRQPANGTVLHFAVTLDCQTSCGNVSFEYPFGIGKGCFRRQEPEFELICKNDHSASQAHRLFLYDGITEVIDDITVPTADVFTGIDVSFSHSIYLRSEVDEYNMSWYLGRSFRLSSIVLNFTGCDFDMYMLENGTNNTVGQCSVTCPDEGITDTVARQNCNGTGCCTSSVELELATGFEFKFVRHKIGKQNLEAHSNRSSIWDTIDVTVDDAEVHWGIIVDQPASGALQNRTDYACLSNHSSDSYFASYLGYTCVCESGYQGNPYITDGCSRDEGYKPLQQKTKCSRWCANINVPFPFGLEDGCSARISFQLNCINSTLYVFQYIDEYPDDYSAIVNNIDINNGILKVKYSLYKEEQFSLHVRGDPGLYVASGESASQQWAVANLTCQEAQQNGIGYACASMNSTCLGVNSASGYVGYRCKCISGFDGNPYIIDRCKDVDECKVPWSCNGICHNTVGSHYCIQCPRKTVYDIATMECTSTREQNLVLGIVIGIGVGFGILLLILIVIFFVIDGKMASKGNYEECIFGRTKVYSYNN